jgi:hypothetical protein
MKSITSLKHATVRSIVAIVVFASMLSVYTAPLVFAASIQVAKDTMTTQKIATSADHLITFNLPGALSAADTIDITFPAGFDLTGATVGTISPAATSGIAGQVVTVTITGAQLAGASYSIPIDGIVNHGTAGTYVVSVAADNGDLGEISIPILNDDQVLVTAKVDQIVNFSLSQNSLNFGSLTTANARFANTTTGSASEAVAHTFTAGTNAPSGYTVSVLGDTLRSQENAANTITAIGGASSPGTEQFGYKAVRTTGVNGVVHAKYANTYALPTVAATAETFATNTGSTANEVYDVTYIANIASLTEAGNYRTSVTYTMTANF